MDEYYVRSTKKQRTIESAFNNFKGVCNFHHGATNITKDYLTRIMPPFESEKRQQVIDHVYQGMISFIYSNK